MNYLNNKRTYRNRFVILASSILDAYYTHSYAKSVIGSYTVIHTLRALISLRLIIVANVLIKRTRNSPSLTLAVHTCDTFCSLLRVQQTRSISVKDYKIFLIGGRKKYIYVSIIMINK